MERLECDLIQFSGLLWRRLWTFEFHKKEEVSRLDEWPLFPQEGLSSMVLVGISKTKMEMEVNKFLFCYLFYINLYQFEIQQHCANVIRYAPLSINKGVAFKNHCVTKSPRPFLSRATICSEYARLRFIFGTRTTFRDINIGRGKLE